MFTKAERLISFRNLRPKKKEGFLKVISVFSFLGIMLGVAILIIVMSVMNGFKTDLTNKILGLNPHIVVQPNGFKIQNKFEDLINEKYENIEISKTYTGEGVIMNDGNAKGIIIKGIDVNENKNLDFLRKNILDGNLENLKKKRRFYWCRISIQFRFNGRRQNKFDVIKFY